MAAPACTSMLAHAHIHMSVHAGVLSRRAALMPRHDGRPTAVVVVLIQTLPHGSSRRQTRLLESARRMRRQKTILWVPAKVLAHLYKIAPTLKSGIPSNILRSGPSPTRAQSIAVVHLPRRRAMGWFSVGIPINRSRLLPCVILWAIILGPTC